MKNHPDLPADAPQWLKDADVENPVWHDGVWHGGEWRGGEWREGVWHGGVWYGGVWHDGVWHGGEWRGGEWREGVWRGGVWYGGEWREGVWRGGVWYGGVWHGGEWHGGVWHGGVWHGGLWRGGLWRGGEWHDDNLERMEYMASIAGIFCRGDRFIGFRTTKSNGEGRWDPLFIQEAGEHNYDHDPAGRGTCRRGIHITGAARAWTYFGVLPTAQMWEVEFTREQLLDCDGEKARISGGKFTRVERPF